MGSEAAQAPTVEGNLASTPLGHVLIYALSKRLNGTFIVYPDPRQSGDPNVQHTFLTRGGMVTAVQAPDAPATLMDALAPLCCQTGGWYQFFEGQDRLDSKLPTLRGTADPRAVVAHALRLGYPETLVDHVVSSLDGKHVAATAALDASAYGLRPEELAWLGQLSGQSSVDALLKDAGLLPAQARRMLYLLRITKTITVVAAPAPAGESLDFEPDSSVVPVETLAPPRGLAPQYTTRWKEILGRYHRIEHDNCFQVLGLPRHANSRAAHAAITKLAKHWAPDRLPAELEPMRPRAEAIYARMREAHRTLSNPFLRNEYLADLDAGGGTPGKQHGLSRVLGRDAHLKEARERAHQRDFDGALGHAHQAVAADDTHPDSIALYSYLRFEVGGRDLQLAQDTLGSLAIALDTSPECALAHRYRGVVLEHLRRPDEAFEHYQRASQIDADDSHSRSRASALQEEQQRQSETSLQDRASSLVGRLFSKLG